MANWIKCSEQMPTEDGWSLVTVLDGKSLGNFISMWMTKRFPIVISAGNTLSRVKTSHTGNRYPSRRRSDTMDYLLLCVAVVIWVKYLC